ncbi:aromatic ring-hydroxylating dioxygenase subunit alpha [Sphingomonas sp. GB1N7]|uniref:aromatic ring-hydroxylating dioxygenase subunit alpha n=1 Tax=Parasphingomonas caseinilytica TaxID=3096158 RepID=UPI002FC75D85
MTFAKNGWYCAAFTSEVGEALLARRILGLPILMTRDSDGRVRAIGDRCPHRFAPLHFGVREGDTVECPYHGLRFDLGGRCVHNPHGEGRIPETARVPTYPTEERDGVVWLWPGDPVLADQSMITDLELVDRGNRVPVEGHLSMPVDYRLILDNLMDLSHAAYIHAGTLSPSRAKRNSRYETDDNSIRVKTVMNDVPTPSSQSLCFDAPRGDYHSDIEWVFPSTLRQRLAMTETNADPGAGYVTRNAHLITPETEHSTHYFWIHTRNRMIDDTDADGRARNILTNAFVNEDEPMIRACEDYMDGNEFFSLQPLYLETDYAGTRCRRMIEKRISIETRGVPDAIPASVSA